MELTFLNGTDLQKAACRTAARNLLNLPFDAIPLVVEVEFVADPLPSLHNEFAFTESTYDSIDSKIKIDNIAPNWSPPWSGVRFLQETFAHELGHAYFAALPQTSRVAIAEMFGAESDDPGELKPPGSEWEDRIGEGIAETFKDAFLPERFRRYSNRTNKRISITRYPEFRALWREASAGINASGGLAVPAYDIDNLYRVTEPPATSFLVSGLKVTQFTNPNRHNNANWPGNEGLWSYGLIEWNERPLTQFYQAYDASADTSIIDLTSPESDFGLLLPPGTEFDFDFDFPEASFFKPRSEANGWPENPYAGEQDVGDLEFIPGLFDDDSLIFIRVLFMYYDAESKLKLWDIWDGMYAAWSHPLVPGGTESNWAYWVTRWGDAEGQKLPHSVNFTTMVPDDVPTVETCGGDMVRVRVYSRVRYGWSKFSLAGLSTPDPPSFSLAEIREQLPVTALHTDRHSCGEGVPIQLPTPLVALGGDRGGRVRSPYPVRGG